MLDPGEVHDEPPRMAHSIGDLIQRKNSGIVAEYRIYFNMRNGEERGFTAAEFRTAQDEGWEKQYPYKVGKKKMYMVPSEAEAQGLVRADKHPKSTRYGRQNPISERWNNEEQLAAWRAAWADVSNRCLERAGREERIDHR